MTSNNVPAAAMPFRCASKSNFWVIYKQFRVEALVFDYARRESLRPLIAEATAPNAPKNPAASASLLLLLGFTTIKANRS